MTTLSDIRAELIELHGTVCWMCEWYPSAPYREFMKPEVQCAHIMGGSHGGNSARKHDRRNAVILCDACHRSYDRHRVAMGKGFYWPKVNLEHVLEVKRLSDGDYYDPTYLNQLLCGSTGRGWKLPEPAAHPADFDQLMFDFRRKVSTRGGDHG